MTRRRRRRRKKLLDDLKDRRGYCQLKEEALDRTMWRNRFGRGFGPVVWQITEDDDTTTTLVSFKVLSFRLDTLVPTFFPLLKTLLELFSADDVQDVRLFHFQFAGISKTSPFHLAFHTREHLNSGYFLAPPSYIGPHIYCVHLRLIWRHCQKFGIIKCRVFGCSWIMQWKGYERNRSS